MQTVFHIQSLVKELKNELLDGTIVSSEFYKKERAAYFIIKKKSRLALAFIFHPAKSGTFLIQPSKINLTTREKPWPIFGLENDTITEIKQLGFDRLIQFTLKKNDSLRYLVIESLGPNGNVWLLNDAYEKEATLRKREHGKNEKYEIPEMTERLNPLTMTPESFIAKCTEKKELALIYIIERFVTGFNLTLASELLARLDIDYQNGADVDLPAATKITEGIQSFSDLFDRYDNGYLYQVKGIHEAYPFKLSTVDSQPEKFKTLSLAVMAASERKNERVEKVDEEKVYLDALKKQIKKIVRRIGKVKEDITRAADYEQYKLYGELLQINFNKIKKGMESISLPNSYDESQPEIIIELNPAQSPNENAEAYFKKHRKGREGLELLERRLQISEGELAQLQQMNSELEQNFSTARAKYASELAALLPKSQTKSAPAERLPYRVYQLSTGLTIFVGRDGADNDRTTFDFAKPYELWFHTQQCAGSHVVMKFPNKSFEPSKREIAETAAVAAFHSKARNDSMVPVIYTERKYVRKPRKAKAGLVTVEREKSVMVEPKEPVNPDE